jgi:ribosome-binding factor A
MSTHRVDKVRESLHREFSVIVQQLKDPRIRFVTVVDTEVSKDLRHAKMFISVLGTDEDKMDALAGIESALGHIRREIAHRLPLRYAPEVAVAYDDTGDRAAKVTALIDQAIALPSLSSPPTTGER